MTYTPIPAGTPNWDVPVNAAFTDQDQRITALQAQGSASTGVYIPPGWGANWRAARNNAGAAAAKVMTVGDSLSFGYYASDLRTSNWVGLMRTALQGQYGNGGSGFFSTARTDAASSVSAAVVNAWIANNSFATEAGTWALGSSLLGPGITFLTANASGATLTFKVTGTNVTIYNFSGSAPRAAFTYSIDGGAPVNVVVPVGPTAVQQTTISGLSNVEHTVVLAWNGLPAEVFFPIGVAGYNATGIIVDQMGRAGSTTVDWSGTPTLVSAYNGGASNPADLVILGLGLNDSIAPVTGENWVKNMTTYLQATRAATGATDLILVHQHYGNFNSGTGAPTYGDYSSRIKDLADNYNAALVNMWTLGRNSYAYRNAQGYWGDGTVPGGVVGTDLVHLSDQGHQVVANAIIPIVMS